MTSFTDTIPKDTRDMPLMHEGGNNIVLFKPFVPKAQTMLELEETISSRWIGQGPKVEKFEQEFSRVEGNNLPSVSVGSGTDALHLAYLLAGVDSDSEVIAPVFTCTATNIPFLYSGASIKFVDICDDSLNIDIDAIEGMITEKTKAISVVHYGGLPCDLDKLHDLQVKYNIPVIQDGAHSLGLRWHGQPMSAWTQYTMYSFQAIKHITTGDGGMLVLNTDHLEDKYAEACRKRWFGIDREKKQGGIWENDITEVGYKYQMTDVGACLGLSGLAEFDGVLKHRRDLLQRYKDNLVGISGIEYYSGDVNGQNNQYSHAAWLCTVIAENRKELQKKLYQHNIESNQVHYRNDRYSIFKDHLTKSHFPNMDKIEDKYLVLPLHHDVSIEDVDRICDCIKSGW